MDVQLRGRGLAELGWDLDPSDYLRPGAVVIARRVLAALHPGAIVIMHDGGGATALRASPPCQPSSAAYELPDTRSCRLLW